jgi:hypothetical protein
MIDFDNALNLNGSSRKDGHHIGGGGALRPGKAMWWLMARIAGCDGEQAVAIVEPLFANKERRVSIPSWLWLCLPAPWPAVETRPENPG